MTSLGRVAIVIYSLIGIPLTLTFLADIGSLLAQVVRLISVRLTSCGRTTRSRRSSTVDGTANGGGEGGQGGQVWRGAPGEVAPAVEAPHHAGCLSALSPEALSVCDDLAEMRTSLGVFTGSMRLGGDEGGSRGSSRRSSLQTAAADPERLRPSRPGPGLTADNNGNGVALHRLGLCAVTNPAYLRDDVTVTCLGDGRQEEENGKGEKKDSDGHRGARDDAPASPAAMPAEDAAGHHHNVPVYVVAAILAVYTLLGAFVVAQVEGWQYGDALYFTFITLTTIGFGDFVPVKHYRDIPSFFGCLVYTIVGLSVMSMCIALVQAKVVSLMSRAAGKMGF